MEITGRAEAQLSQAAVDMALCDLFTDENALQQQIPGTRIVSTGEQWELSHGADLKPTLPAYSHLPPIVSSASPRNCHAGTSYVISHFSKSPSSPKWQMLVPN